MNTKKSYEKYRAEFRVKKTKNGYDFSKLQTLKLCLNSFPNVGAHMNGTEMNT